RKAVSVLNSAITMNMALDGETPYDNSNTFGYLMKHMSVIKSTTLRSGLFYVVANEERNASENAVFYTTDGMRFELRYGMTQYNTHPLYENSNVYLCTSSLLGVGSGGVCMGCGSYGLNNNPYNTTKPPCLIMVDVNGDRKPNPANVNCKYAGCGKPYKYSDPDGKKMTDIFSLMITDKEVIPYGMAAQKAMYQARK
ncbi:MAG: hypothetical protein Q4F80_03360, partial [bacterium]|nr:hypothetical protein [bacterium]